MILLASASPRRRALLTQIGIEHQVLPAHLDETRFPAEQPEAYVRRLALAKAQAVARQHGERPVLAADTTVALDGAVLNKPRDHVEAEKMLRALSGRTHRVHTGVAVVHGERELSHVETTAVQFALIEEQDLARYLATGDSLDKAGAYGIQGFAARWISGIEGDFFNVVGLPLCATLRLLREGGAL